MSNSGRIKSPINIGDRQTLISFLSKRSNIFSLIDFISNEASTNKSRNSDSGNSFLLILQSNKLHLHN